MKFMKNTEQFWKLEKFKNERFTKKILIIEWYLEYNLLAFYCLAICAIIFFLLPLFMGQQIFEMYNPGLPNIFVGIFQFYVLIACIVFPIIGFDSFYYLFVNMVFIQFKLLNHRSLIFVKKYPDFFIKKRIRKWIEHHNRLLQ